jgi:hypothetical protein
MTDAQDPQWSRWATAQISAVESLTQLDRTLKFVICCSLLSVLFCSQIALNVGEFPASLDFFCYLLFASHLLLSGTARINPTLADLFLISLMTGLISTAISDGFTSWSSFFLLIVLYAPFNEELQSSARSQQVHSYISATFVSLACIIAAIALVQLALVNAFKGSEYLLNISFVLPEQIRGAGNYAFYREAGSGLVKANGFFLRESSTLSILTSLAWLFEFYDRARASVLLLLGAGSLASISGSGLLIILVALLFPTTVRKIPFFFVGILALGVLLTYGSELPGLNLWLDRLSEFQTPGSSGYARFVAPYQIVERSFADAWSAWLGVGAGAYLRTIPLLRVKFEINDPTWAKLLYEYGVVGFLSWSMMLIIRLRSSELRIEICAAIFYAWISTGSVLKPDFVFLTWILTLAPSSGRARIQTNPDDALAGSVRPRDAGPVRL